MEDLKKFNYECEGQMSLFDGMLREQCDTKPEVGTKLIFHHNGKDYLGVVDTHCGMDYFHIKLTDNIYPDTPSGVHLSLRGYKKSWDYAEVGND